MNTGKKFISVVTPCYNEAANVEELCARIRAQFEQIGHYDYEHILIDNASTDATVARVKALAAKDKRIKLIVNTRNFGHVRSPLHGALQARGDAIILMASDLQDPPELIAPFIAQWEAGYRLVIGTYQKAQDKFLMAMARRLYYATIGRISEIELIPNFTGFGLYDRSVIDIIRGMDDRYPYFRGLISELGIDYHRIEYHRPSRPRGITKNNFYTLYDAALLGITSHSKLPIRLATMAGFVLAGVSLLVSLLYVVLKLLFWDSFSVGVVPILAGLFFFGSVQLFFLGLIGEYVGAIYTQVHKRPLVVERERVNFDGE